MRILPILWAVCAWAQSGIEVPTTGAIVDSSGGLRPIQGLAGNFLLGPATMSGILSAACSERLCLAKSDSGIDSKIFSVSGEVDAPPGPAIFSLDGEDAVVYFPEQRTFARWHDNTLDPLDWTVEGGILSIRVSGHEIDIAVRRDENIWLVRPDGAVVEWIADTLGPVLLLAEGVLFATPDELVLRHLDGSEVRFDLAGADSISAMGAHYAAIRAGDAVYALRTESGREQLYLLPGNAE